MSSKQRRFELMVGALTNDLYRYGYWLCRDPHVAEDLVQETLLRAWRFMDQLRDSKAVKAWLITTLRREHARLYERKRLEIADVDETIVEDPQSRDLLLEVDRNRMRQEILALEDDYREPLALQVVFGCSVKEIAKTMELSESAVMTRLFRARKRVIASFDDVPDRQIPEEVAS